MQKTLHDLQIKNQILEQKVEVLNTANDKIIGASYGVIAIVLAIGAWNGIQTYRINKAKLAAIRNDLAKEIYDQVQVKVDTNMSAQKNALKYETDKLFTHIIDNEFTLRQMTCASIEERVYRDMNVEAFNLMALLNAAREYYKLTLDEDRVKDALNHILKYIEKYPDAINVERYDTERLRETVDLVDIASLDAKKAKILAKLT
ncbi:hypothetical protein CK934_25475 [Chitinophaga sp. MD30]|nr:hypothetical protein CK934_25475 [Chitinophaga sp. MD30]